MGEAEIIALLAARAGGRREDVVLGIGDDAALLRPPPDRLLTCAMDTLNEGVHFPQDMPARWVGHRVLAVNLSDLAAMGAEPAWATLSLSLPRPDADWLEEFAAGLARACMRFGVALVGGDTVRGPLSVSVHLTGFVEPGMALTRGGAAPGDGIYVTGTPGEAAAGLALWAGGRDRDGALCRRFLDPEPRVAAGRSLRGVASAAIDLSDGLAVDLARMMAASGTGADLESRRLPVSPAAGRAVGDERARRWLLFGGDDYELCFTAPETAADRLAGVAAGWDCGLTRIGRVVAGAGVRLDGAALTPGAEAWSHFRETAT